MPRQATNKHTGIRKKPGSPSASKVAAYAGAFLLLVAVVAIGYESPQQASSQAAIIGADANENPAASKSVAPSVDQVVATDIAADLAGRANLPVARNIESMAISLSAKTELAQTDTSAITKPQIIQPNGSRTEIITYTVVEGDTVPSIAAKFGISADTVRWANDLGNTDAVAVGSSLSILPTNGVMHNVESGDTVESIASKYNSSAARIVSINSLELSGVSAGQKLVVPDGIKPAPTPAPVVRGGGSGSQGTGSRIATNVFATAGNRYALGNCTWYVYERRAQIGRPIGSFWGNANTWDTSAIAAGFTVGRVPQPGAIMQWDEYSEPYITYAGHVAFVERVLDNGDVVISEMNNGAYGGFNIVNQRTISAAQAAERKYIY